jgi:hypothetical protein
VEIKVPIKSKNIHVVVYKQQGSRLGHPTKEEFCWTQLVQFMLASGRVKFSHHHVK